MIHIDKNLLISHHNIISYLNIYIYKKNQLYLMYFYYNNLVMSISHALSVMHAEILHASAIDATKIFLLQNIFIKFVHYKKVN